MNNISIIETRKSQRDSRSWFTRQ